MAGSTVMALTVLASKIRRPRGRTLNDDKLGPPWSVGNVNHISRL